MSCNWTTLIGARSLMMHKTSGWSYFSIKLAITQKISRVTSLIWHRMRLWQIKGSSSARWTHKLNATSSGSTGSQKFPRFSYLVATKQTLSESRAKNSKLKKSHRISRTLSSHLTPIENWAGCHMSAERLEQVSMTYKSLRGRQMKR